MSAESLSPTIQPLVLTVESVDEVTIARRTAVNLMRNLNSTGVLRAVETRNPVNLSSSIEKKNCAALLSSISLKIIEGAAAKLVIEGIVNAIKAAFASNRGRNLSLKLSIHGKVISIKGESLSAHEMGALIKTLETELGTL